MRKNLAAWQWSGYPTFHQRPLTLWIHLLAVPVFVASTFSLIASLATLQLEAAAGSAVTILLAFALQGIGHKMEPNPAIPFDGPLDFVTRVFLEQFFTFPRFVLTGGWWRALRGASTAASGSNEA